MLYHADKIVKRFFSLFFILTSSGFKGYNASSLQQIIVKRTKMKFFLCVIGMVMIFEGLPYFGFPEKMKQWLVQMLELENSVLRMMGFVLMAIGLVLVYWGRC